MPLFAILIINPFTIHESSDTQAAANVAKAEPAVFSYAVPMRRDPSMSTMKAHLASHARKQRAFEEKQRKRAHRRAIRHDSRAWANTRDAIKVANCESGGPWGARTYKGDAHDRNNPDYRGKWQIGWAEWRYFGGTGDPADASEREQDYRAWRYWMRSGWRPWQCADLTGVS